MTQRLAPVDLAAALLDLPDLHRGPAGSLRLRLKAPSFPAAIELVDRVAVSAEKMDHHPDIDIRWRTVTFGLSTHSVGGVSQLDIDLARLILEHATAVSAGPFRPRAGGEVRGDTADPEAIRPFWRVGLGYVEQLTEEGDYE